MADWKLAVIVPGPFIVTVVELDDEEATAMLPVVFHRANMFSPITLAEIDS